MTNRDPGPCADSRKWFTHFSLRSMTALHVSRNEALQLTEKERSIITKSIQQFQLGEGSKGQRLLDRGQKYGHATNDSLFAGALEMFIKEEQQHSRYLASFMESQSISLVHKHWVDTVFRKLRGLAGLELSLTVLVTAEIISVPYYRALRAATASPILKLICTRLLEDEANHLRFQASMLARVGSKRPLSFQRALGELHRAFLSGTLLVVWIEHRPVFEAAGYGFLKFKKEALSEFSDWNALRNSLRKHSPARQKSSHEQMIKNGGRVESGS
jgi:1,2-phenylacetyl-CoA epoxidase catalytic subunit